MLSTNNPQINITFPQLKHYLYILLLFLSSYSQRKFEVWKKTSVAVGAVRQWLWSDESCQPQPIESQGHPGPS